MTGDCAYNISFPLKFESFFRIIQKRSPLHSFSDILTQRRLLLSQTFKFASDPCQFRFYRFEVKWGTVKETLSAFDVNDCIPFINCKRGIFGNNNNCNPRNNSTHFNETRKMENSFLRNTFQK